MKRPLFLLSILAALVCESFAAGPSAAKIIDRFKKASRRQGRGPPEGHRDDRKRESSRWNDWPL
jgi:hypothetical protein